MPVLPSSQIWLRSDRSFFSSSWAAPVLSRFMYGVLPRYSCSIPVASFASCPTPCSIHSPTGYFMDGCRRIRLSRRASSNPLRCFFCLPLNSHAPFIALRAMNGRLSPYKIAKIRLLRVNSQSLIFTILHGL